MLPANFVTHQAACSRLHSGCSKAVADPPGTSDKGSARQKPAAVKSKKKESGPRSGAAVVPTDDGDDLDAMLAELALTDTRCKFANCPKSVNLVSQRCSFCKGRFCMAHGIPEVHGCEAAAKRQARQDACSSSAAGSKPKKALNPAKRAHLQRTLGKKIDEASCGRRSKRETGK